MNNMNNKLSSSDYDKVNSQDYDVPTQIVKEDGTVYTNNSDQDEEPEAADVKIDDTITASASSSATSSTCTSYTKNNCNSSTCTSNTVTPNSCKFRSTSKTAPESDEIHSKKRNSYEDEETENKRLRRNLRSSDASGLTHEQTKNWMPRARRIFNEKLRSSVNPVSFEGRRESTRQRDSNELEVDMCEADYCPGCQQVHERCHLKVHAHYIQKKIFVMYKDTSSPLAGGADSIMANIKTAYNESRRVDYCKRFRIYDAQEEELPTCLLPLANKVVTSVKEVAQACKINAEIRQGIVQMLRAKRFRRC